MTTRSIRASAGFGWLTQGFSVGFRNPAPLLGGAGILLFAGILPSLITLPAQLHELRAAPTSSPPFHVGWMLVMMLYSVALIPLYGGYLRVVASAEDGHAARARDVFQPYRDGTALRLIGFTLAMMLVYVAAIGVVLIASGGSLVHWWIEAVSAKAQHLPPPSLPSGFGVSLLLGALLALVLTGVHAIGLGQVALQQRGVLGAVGDGFSGTLKNLPSFFAFALTVVVAWLGLVVAMIVLAMLGALLVKLVGGWLVVVVFIPIYLALMLVAFVGMFGVNYRVWRDICGTDGPPPVPEPLAA